MGHRQSTIRFGLAIALTLSAAACGRRPIQPPPIGPVTPPAPTAAPTAVPSLAPIPTPVPSAVPVPSVPPASPSAPVPSAAPVTPPAPPLPGPSGAPGPSAEPPPTPPAVQPTTESDFWAMVARMGLSLPKPEIQRQIIETTSLVPTTWSPGTAGNASANLAIKFADNQRYFSDPPTTAEDYAQRSLAFAGRKDANTSYYLDLRFSLKGGGNRIVLLKFDQATFEVLGTNASNRITWYSQWKGTLKLPSYLLVPATVYQKPADPTVTAATFRR